MIFRAHSLVLCAVLVLASGGSHAGDALSVCLNENAPPYSVRHKGSGAGFDLAVAEALARRLGRPLEVQWFDSKLDEDSSGALEANALLSDGRCQPADRRRRITLGTLLASKPYHFAPLTIVLGGAAVERPIAGLGDLDGVAIGVEGGTLSDTILMSFGEGRLIDRITHLVPGRGQLWTSLERGEFDAALVPLHRFDAYRAEHADTKLRASGYLYPVGFNIGFVGLARDERLMADVDAAVASMLSSGEIAGLAPKADMTYLVPRAPDVQKHLLLSDLAGK